MSKSKKVVAVTKEQSEEIQNYEQVPVDPLPCSTEEAESHVKAFIATFVAPEARQRWITRLLETKHRINIGRIFGSFDEQHVELLCKELRHKESWPQALGKRLGSGKGVYFGEGAEICKVTAAEAATLGFENNAIWSLKEGAQALLFVHDGPIWLCEKITKER